MISEFSPKNSKRRVVDLLSLLATLVLCASCDLNLQEQTTTLIQEEPVRITHTGSPKSTPAWSPDGTMIAYSSSTIATSFIQVSFLNEEIARIGMLPGRADISWRARLAFAPDWTQVAYRREDDDRIWIADLRTNREQALTTQAGFQYQPAWSPDGRWVAFGLARGNPGNIWITSPAGGLPTAITPDEAFASYPTWSPDATEIAYSSAFTDTVDGRTVNRQVVRIVSIAGEGFRQLLPDSILAGYPSWSPDGNTIAFWADINDSTGLWTSPASGGKLNFIAPIQHADIGIAWSPDGSKIAFVDFDFVNVVSVDDRTLVATPVAGIYPNWYKGGESFVVPEGVSFGNINLVAIGDSSVTALTTPSEFQSDSDPVWSQDGEVYFFRTSSNRRGNTRQIWNVDVQTRNERLIVDDIPPGLGVYNGDICADGKRFLFDNSRDIFLGDLEISSIINLTEEIDASVYDASFSPDCEQFVALSAGDVVIYEIESEMGVERLRIPQLVGRRGAFFSRGRVAWSPNVEGIGSHIAVEDYAGRIFIFTPDNPEPLQIAVGSYPAWSPDGTQLTYVAGDGELYVFKAIVALNN